MPPFFSGGIFPDQQRQDTRSHFTLSHPSINIKNKLESTGVEGGHNPVWERLHKKQLQKSQGGEAMYSD